MTICFRSILSCVLVALIFLSACKKGDTGPKGATGTANVMYSDWVYAKNFRDTTIDNSAMHVADIVEPKLVDSIVQKAAILVYFTYGGGVFPLPHITNAGGKSSIINFIPRIGKFNITRYTLDNSNSVNLSTVLQYRYVIIPGGVSAAVTNLKTAIRHGQAAMLDDGTVIDYAHMSYEEVCARLHIKQ